MKKIPTPLVRFALLCLISTLALPADALTQVEAQKLLASDGAGGDEFGFNVGIDGDTAVVGAVADDGNRGAAYVFTGSGIDLDPAAKLVASDARRQRSEIGAAAIAGDTVVVGAWFNNDSGIRSGAAYVFTRSGTVWTQQAKLLASDRGSDDGFGYRVAIAADTAVIGAVYGDTYRGAAYVFTRSGTSWTQQAKLVAGDRATYDGFGDGVAISGDTAVIAAYQSDAKGSDSGAAYVFTRSGTTWMQQAKLTASDGASGDFFGTWVTIDGDTSLIGAFFNDTKGTDSGAAYVYTRSGTT